MLRSMHSPPDPHDDHLRRLLDQRTTRADLHSRFPSMSNSDLSDTPSIYSRSFFSPRPSDAAHSEFGLDDTRSLSLPRSLPAPRQDRDRLNDLALSMLDRENDPRLSFVSSNDSVDNLDDDDDDGSLPRMSLLGPKMRFHSRAPWEVDEGPIHEDEEVDSMNDQSFRSNASSGKGTFGAVVGFGRRSGESLRSQLLPKRSFEAASPRARNALHAPYQHQNLSSTSLLSSPVGQTNSRKPFSSDRVRPHSPSIVNSPGISPRSVYSVATPYVPSSPAAIKHEESYDTRSLHMSERSRDESLHPYANPDHAIAESPKAHHAFPACPVSPSDSSATVSDSLGLMGPKIGVIPSDNGPSAPVQSRVVSPIQGKGISSPMPIQGNGIRNIDGDSPAYAGWTDKSPMPAFTLISLEEARAQRSRSATVHPESRSSGGSSGVSSGSIEADLPTSAGPISNTLPRTRARTISAGTRAKQTLHNMIVKPSEPALPQLQHSPGSNVKPLKPKKSGFLRLFNGSDKLPAPPVPPLSDAFNSQQATVSQEKTPKISVHRIPPPQVSPSLLAIDPSIDSASTSKLSSKRTPPPLTINITNATHLPREPVSAIGERFSEPHISSRDSISLSAPADVTEFPALKLRPVSVMFSSHFSDHLISEAATDDDADTPSSLSPNTVVSPVTPSLYSNRAEEKSITSLGHSDDQSAVIRALQEQIVTAKKDWQRHIWELEGQVRDLKAEIDELRNAGAKNGQYCEACGRGRQPHEASEKKDRIGNIELKNTSVVNRPRARTGTGSSRFGSAI